eukprot:TRINITY_DN2102_c0_g1_i1.p1 TRINITY_DN2102_c0_g1~~TRINITY_DN2102_c0_g1_i1.p1  ORF type:complete len:379 (-),score=59.98 TRINITY_DN2102_c0_g1_i1:374-1510(-)
MLAISYALQGVIPLTIAYASQGVATCVEEGNNHAKWGAVLLQTRSSAQDPWQPPGALVSSAANSDNTSQNDSTSWYAWERRFPELAKMTKAERWLALEANWWYVFIDGKAHAKGLHAFDKPVVSSFDSGTQTSEHMKQMYERFKKPEAWGWRWTVEKVEALNSFYQGKNCEIEPCGGPKIYTTWVPRYGMGKDMTVRKEVLETDQNQTLTNIFPFPVPNCSEFWLPTQEQKRTALASLLEDYYTALDVASGQDCHTVLQSGLRYVAKLFYRLADLHPFADGNSRTRNFLLQTMLVELGGHPTVMWDDYWEIYFQPSLEKIEEKILHGWCAWEMAYQTGTSPFVVAGQNHSVPFLTYDPQTKSCREKPAPWPNAFGKPL